MRAGAWQRQIGGRLVTLTGLALPPEGTTPAARGARAKSPRDADGDARRGARRSPTAA